MCACCVFHGHCCHQVLIASDEQRKKARKSRGGSSQSEMMTQVVAATRGRSEVERAAKAVYSFLKNEDSQLRKYISALSDGGVYFVSNVHCKGASAAVRYRKETEESTPGISSEEFVLAIQGRLCE